MTGSGGPLDWDARTYDRVAAPIVALGHEVLGRLELRGDETVLDAGCGTGQVSDALLDRLPRGRLIAVDGSPRMVELARRRLGERADVRVCDLLELDLGGERVDAALSTATFHWIADHDRLFARLRAALRDGGRLVAQCGGEGNIAAVRVAIAAVAGRDPFAEHVGDYDPWNFAGPDETEARLRAAGFTDARCWLEPRPVRPDAPFDFFATMMLGAHRERLPGDVADIFTAAVVEEMGSDPVVDYVRLNIDAIA